MIVHGTTDDPASSELDSLRFERDALKQRVAELEQRLLQPQAAGAEPGPITLSFDTLFEFAPIGIRITDTKGDCVSANPCWCALTGLAPEEAVGGGWRNSIHPEDREAVDACWKQMAPSQAPWGTEYRVRTPAGKETWVYGLVAPLRNAADQLVGSLSVILDISARKQAEQALRESEERFRELSELLPQTVFECDLTGRMTFVNQKGFDAFRYQREDFERGVNIFDTVIPEDRKRAAANMRAVAGGGRTGHEYTALRKDGTRFPVISYSSIILSDGVVVGLRGITIDITEQRSLEEQLRQSQKMEALGQLAGGIAHDFNNQLSVMMGCGEMLVAKVNEPAVAKYAKYIVTSAEQSADLIRQLLAFARKGQYTAKPVNVHGVLTEAMTVLRRTFNKKIRLKQAFQAEQAVVLGDPSLLETAFLNLALNARDAMPDGGELLFTTETVVLDAAQIEILDGEMDAGPHLLVSVKDMGHGMSEEVRKRVFEPFFTTKGPGKGTGLGLAAVYGTVKRHGGAITVESEPGRGTTFRMYLPVTSRLPAPPSDTASCLSAIRAQQEGRILLVDDEKGLVDLMRDALGDLGYTVVCKADGAAANEYYQRHSREVDLVVMDMNMPRMGGMKTFAAMRRVNPAAKVLIISGFGDEGEVAELLRQGAVGFLAKPFRPKALGDSVRKALQ